MKSKVLHYLGALILFAGLLFAFLPHALHSKIGIEENKSHIFHVFLGMGIAAMGLIMLIINGRAKSKSKPAKQKV